MKTPNILRRIRDEVNPQAERRPVPSRLSTFDCIKVEEELYNPHHMIAVAFHARIGQSAWLECPLKAEALKEAREQIVRATAQEVYGEVINELYKVLAELRAEPIHLLGRPAITRIDNMIETLRGESVIDK